jgi:hypothetical protein
MQLGDMAKKHAALEPLLTSGGVDVDFGIETPREVC